MCIFKKRKIKKVLDNYIYDFQHNYCCKDVRNYAKSFDERIKNLEGGGVIVTDYVLDAETSTNTITFTIHKDNRTISRTFAVDFSGLEPRFTELSNAISAETQRAIARENDLENQIISGGGRNVKVVSNLMPEQIPYNLQLTNLAKDELGRVLFQFWIKFGYRNNPRSRAYYIIDTTNHTIVTMLDSLGNGDYGGLASDYELVGYYRQSTDDYVVGIQSKESSTNRKDMYISFNADATIMNIQLNGDYVVYQVGSEKSL